ncbi:MAG: hypothetical protein H7Z40_12070 [Phycisphaerae bacterium]|nr:hypothetical protein [Gemmatimonadaceae bacterium]
MRIHLSFALILVALSAACHQPRQRATAVGQSGLCTARVENARTTAFGGRAPANPGATFDSAWTIIARSHWDSTLNGVNWSAVRDSLRPSAVAARNNAQLRQVLGKMLGTLGQSHFSVFPGDDAASDEEQSPDQSGNTGLTVRDADPEMLVTAVRPGSAAARVGVRPGFAIVAIDGCPLPPRGQFRASAPDDRKLKLDRWRDATGKIRGPVGDSVELALRDGEGRIVVFRAARELDPGEYTRIGNLPAISVLVEKERRVLGARTVGIIRFNAWMPKLSQAIAAAVDSLRDADAIVLDLRGNVGGIGMMSTGVAGHFVDSALTLGTMIQRGGTQKYVINPQRVNGANRRVIPFAGPLALVVDELSVSTSEIFAAGLQALGRARVFGARTPGQALPSVAESLPNGDILYHAIANFLSPTGQPVEGAGVTPDVAVPISRARLLRGDDAALDAALEWAASATPQSPQRR